jgi:protein TonB
VAQKSLLGLSILFHGALAVLVFRIESAESRAATAIQVAESKKKEAPKAKVDDAPKPPPEPPKRAAKRAAAAEKVMDTPPPSAAPAPLEALPDFGLELGGGIGGLAVAPAPETLGAAQKGPVAARAAAPTAVKRTAAVHAPSSTADECDEPPAKPKPKNVPQPAYTDRAREAGIEGKVRIELTVDETGRVVGVRVLSGLGYGLDEAAVAAAQSASFEPAIRCGKPSRATFTISMRFSSS